MASVMRHTAVWSGTIGLPGYSNFYHSVSDPVSTSAQEASDSIRTYFAALSGYIPGEVSVLVDPAYQIYDDATGNLVAEGTVAVPAANVVGSNGGTFSSQVGVLVEWLTGVYIAGHRVRGRTYLVPLAGFAELDGTLNDAIRTTIQNASVWIVDASENFVVWHRPVNGAGGSVSAITAGRVQDHAAILRSRAR